MSLINIQENHKNDLKILLDQPLQVLADFCKLASNFLVRGSSQKLYQVASQKLGINVSQIQSAVEGLVFLFLEAYKNDLNEELFRELIIGLGFKEDFVETIHKEYLNCVPLLNKALPQTSVSYPRFSDLEWRFETQVSSKSIRNEIIPRIIMKLDLEKHNKIESLCIQSDIPNLLHMSRMLNQALEESRTNHSRRIHRAVT